MLGINSLLFDSALLSAFKQSKYEQAYLGRKPNEPPLTLAALALS